LFIREPNHAKAEPLQDSLPLHVRLFPALVDRAIDFQDHACRVAVEIGDESMDHLLPAEVKPG
jgi:hypothetical protein